MLSDPYLTRLVTTKKLNREDLEDREENIFYGLHGYRSCQIMRWIPSLMRVTCHLIKKPVERPLSLRNEQIYFFFAVFAVFVV
jgi:hypothetical protein